MHSDFQDVTAHLGSSLDKGSAREDAVREFVRMYLPPRLGAENGELTDCQGQVTGQLDLVVYDREEAPPLFSSPTVKVFPCEAARAVVEVKSRLSLPGLREDAEKIRCAKALSRQLTEPVTQIVLKGLERDEWPPVLGGVFAFEASASLRRLGEELQTWNCSVEESQRLDFVIILSRGILACGRDDYDYPGLYFPAAECGLTMFEQQQTPAEMLLILTTYIHWRVAEFDAFAGRAPSLVFARYLSEALRDLIGPPRS